MNTWSKNWEEILQKIYDLCSTFEFQAIASYLYPGYHITYVAPLGSTYITYILTTKTLSGINSNLTYRHKKWWVEGGGYKEAMSSNFPIGWVIAIHINPVKLPDLSAFL